ncbi:MAG: YbhB/YbcL family Raf kinase inhibitor-like protein [Verrucomicrobia bacterium]|nr:YbhB/YbcL family Raf kinase inhibitor-like protein [Verrucomicrobiota bacterium]
MRPQFELRLRRLSVALACLLAAGAFGAEQNPSKKEKPTMKLTSTAFTDGQAIPVKHTCLGADVSPALRWTDVPVGTKSLALICDDPDAPVGTWVHWVLWGLPPSATELPEKVPTSETLPSGAKQGLNDFRRIGYGGPCPPAGKPHRYFFKLYALDADLPLKPRATKQDLEAALQGHILAQAQLLGTYQRR